MNPRCRYVDLGPFVRRSDGIWCRKDAVGRLCPVNGNGERCAKPKKFERSDGAYDDQRHPSEVSPRVWWKMMKKAERLQWWKDEPEGFPVVKSKHDIARGPRGISPMVANTPKALLHMWPGK